MLWSSSSSNEGWTLARLQILVHLCELHLLQTAWKHCENKLTHNLNFEQHNISECTTWLLVLSNGPESRFIAIVDSLASAHGKGSQSLSQTMFSRTFPFYKVLLMLDCGHYSRSLTVDNWCMLQDLTSRTSSLALLSRKWQASERCTPAQMTSGIPM